MAKRCPGGKGVSDDRREERASSSTSSIREGSIVKKKRERYSRDLKEGGGSARALIKKNIAPIIQERGKAFSHYPLWGVPGFALRKIGGPKKDKRKKE